MRKSDTIKVLIFGDVFGRIGRQAIVKELPKLRKKYSPDLVIANSENIAHGSGMTHKTLKELQDAGVDFFTGGNHTFDAVQGIQILKETDPVAIRPLNMKAPGAGHKLLTFGKKRVLVINLMGQLFMNHKTSNPFRSIKTLLKKYGKERLDAVIVDMHAEATSEKMGMGYYLDGKASVVYGTHSHVQTADDKILPNGTGYITDVGMTGPYESVIGMDKDDVVANFLKGIKGKAAVPEKGKAILCTLYVEINSRTRKAETIKRISKIINQ